MRITHRQACRDPKATVPNSESEYRVLIISGADAATAEYWATAAGAETEDCRWAGRSEVTADDLRGNASGGLLGETGGGGIEWLRNGDRVRGAARAVTDCEREPDGPGLIVTTTGPLPVDERRATGLAKAVRASRTIAHWPAEAPSPALDELIRRWARNAPARPDDAALEWFRVQLTGGRRRFGAWAQAERTAMAVQRGRPEAPLPQAALALTLAHAAPDAAESESEARNLRVADAVIDGRVRDVTKAATQPGAASFARGALLKTWGELRLRHDLLAAGLHHAPSTPRPGIYVPADRRATVTAQLTEWRDVDEIDPMMNHLWPTVSAAPNRTDAETIWTALTETAWHHPRRKHEREDSQ